MKVLDPGHRFMLEELDGGSGQILYFVKRDNPPEKYPGNVGHFPGPNIQEVFRACIARVQYLDEQAGCIENPLVIKRLRECIHLLEMRNAIKKDLLTEYNQLVLDRDINRIEEEPVCPECKHVVCNEH